MYTRNVQKLTFVMLLLWVSRLSAQTVEFFPNQAFDQSQRLNNLKTQWYTRALKALQEPSLLQQAATREQVYRFLWLRSFHKPVAIRMNVRFDGTSLLTCKVTSGQGGYEPGKLTQNTIRKLPKRATDSFLTLVQDVNYWNVPTEQSPDPNVVNLDGAQWIIEAIKDGKYKVVDRWSPKTGAAHALGAFMLINLARMKLPDEEVY